MKKQPFLAHKPVLRVLCILSAIYFLVLGSLNLIMTAMYADVKIFDYLVFLLALLPVLFRHKIVFLTIGVIASFCAAYILLSLLLSAGGRVFEGSSSDFLIGLLLALASGFGGAVFIWTGLDRYTRRAFLL